MAEAIPLKVLAGLLAGEHPHQGYRSSYGGYVDVIFDEERGRLTIVFNRESSIVESLLPEGSRYDSASYTFQLDTEWT